MMQLKAIWSGSPYPTSPCLFGRESLPTSQTKSLGDIGVNVLVEVDFNVRHLWEEEALEDISS